MPPSLQGEKPSSSIRNLAAKFDTNGEVPEAFSPQLRRRSSRKSLNNNSSSSSSSPRKSNSNSPRFSSKLKLKQLSSSSSSSNPPPPPPPSSTPPSASPPAISKSLGEDDLTDCCPPPTPPRRTQSYNPSGINRPSLSSSKRPSSIKDLASKFEQGSKDVPAMFSSPSPSTMRRKKLSLTSSSSTSPQRKKKTSKTISSLVKPQQEVESSPSTPQKELQQQSRGIYRSRSADDCDDLFVESSLLEDQEDKEGTASSSLAPTKSPHQRSNDDLFAFSSMQLDGEEDESKTTSSRRGGGLYRSSSEGALSKAKRKSRTPIRGILRQSSYRKSIGGGSSTPRTRTSITSFSSCDSSTAPLSQEDSTSSTDDCSLDVVKGQQQQQKVDDGTIATKSLLQSDKEEAKEEEDNVVDHIDDDERSLNGSMVFVTSTNECCGDDEDDVLSPLPNPKSGKNKKNIGLSWSIHEPAVKLVDRFSDSATDRMFYTDEDLANQRHEAWMEECGLQDFNLDLDDDNDNDNNDDDDLIL